MPWNDPTTVCVNCTWPIKSLKNNFERFLSCFSCFSLRWEMSSLDVFFAMFSGPCLRLTFSALIPCLFVCTTLSWCDLKLFKIFFSSLFPADSWLICGYTWWAWWYFCGKRRRTRKDAATTRARTSIRARWTFNCRHSRNISRLIKWCNRNNISTTRAAATTAIVVSAGAEAVRKWAFNWTESPLCIQFIRQLLEVKVWKIWNSF